jgi:glycosyltransferase involved in cell wall biosynthesis
MEKPTPSVLMVTGAYFPEVSGAGLQCRELVRQLHGSVRLTILTTTADPTARMIDRQDGVPVHRVFIDPSSRWSKIVGAVRLTMAVFRNRHRFSILHLHGFSKKSILLSCFAVLRRWPIVIKMTSVGHDDPVSMKARGGLAYRCYSRAALHVGVSSRMTVLYERAGLPLKRYRLIPNGVDLVRFRPSDEAERQTLRRQLKLPDTGHVVLFVGFFSAEKCPASLFDAWASLALSHPEIGPLVFVGATHSQYYEVDPRIAENIKLRASELGLGARVVFVEHTLHIEQYYRAADIFVLPSRREGLPNALLEAMASGVACIASHLDGVTDDLIEDGVNGLLVSPGEVAELKTALRVFVDYPERLSLLGRQARQTIETHFAIEQTAQEYLNVYRSLMERPACVA